MQESLTPAEVAAFEDERRQRSLIPVRLACVLGISAFVAFAFVDPYVVRQSVANLFVARIVIVATISAVLGASFTAVGARRVADLAVLACLAIGGG